MKSPAKKVIYSAALFILLALSASPARAQGQTLVASRSSLPPCNMDSFVYQAGAQAQMIYGDEGDVDIPPLFGFTQASRINTGINGVNDAGLTTGHGSYMPSAWGADEFLAPPGEWNRSGTNFANGNYNNAAALLDAQDAASQYTEAAQSAASAAASAAVLNNMFATIPDPAVPGDTSDSSTQTTGDTSSQSGDDSGYDPNAYQGGTHY